MNKLLKFIVFSVAGILIFEIFFWNISSFRMIFGGYAFPREFDLNSAKIENGYVENGKIYSNGSGNVNVIFDDLDYRIGTLTLDVERDNEAKTHVSGAVSDDAYSAKERWLFNADIIRNNKYCQTYPCNFSGDVSYLRLSFETGGRNLVISEISTNKKVPMQISFLRMFLEFLVLMLFYFLFFAKISRETFKSKEVVCKFITYSVCAVFIFLSALSMGTQMKNTNTTFKSQLKLDYGNQISQELVDSFEKGTVSLLDKPSEEFKKIEDPYDDSQRTDMYYPWDHLYKDGEYYSYYGIGPVLSLFLPYHMLTDNYFSTYFAVFLYGSAGVIFLSLLVLVFFKKFASYVSVSMYTMSIIMMLVSCSVWTNYITPNFYEIAQISGFAALTSGAYFLLSAGLFGKDDTKISPLRVALGTACLGYGVLCRPTIALYCFPALFVLYLGYKKLYSLSAGKKQKIIYCVCALSPFAVFGIIQATYNFLRFGNPFDFGIQYTLTIYNYNDIEFHWIFAIVGFINYLFAVPHFDIKFPFAHPNYQDLNLNGYYYVANVQAIGLLFRSAPVIGFFFAKKAYNQIDNENKKPYSILFAMCCIIIPFIIIFSIWQYGYGFRYATDFAFIMLLGGFAICFTLYKNLNSTTKKLLNMIFACALVVSFITNFSIVYEYQIGQVYDNSELLAEFLSFERLFTPMRFI